MAGASLLEEFERDGVVVVPDALPAALLVRLQQAFAAGLATVPPAVPEGTKTEDYKPQFREFIQGIAAGIQLKEWPYPSATLTLWKRQDRKRHDNNLYDRGKKLRIATQGA